jgi:hypothetical protein
MMLQPVPDRTYSDAELDAALTAITAPGRLGEAQDVVLRTVPSLQRILADVLLGGGWFDSGHAEAVRAAASAETPSDREREVQTLVAEETRVGMMVGVAIGFELSRELDRTASADPPTGPDRPRASGDQPLREQPAARGDPPAGPDQTSAPGGAPADQTTDKED